MAFWETWPSRRSNVRYPRHLIFIVVRREASSWLPGPPSANKLDSSTSIALILDHRLAAFLYLPRFNPFHFLQALTRFVFQCRLLVTPSFNQTNSSHDNMSSAILDVDAAPLQVRAPRTPTPTHKETRCGQQHHPRPHLSHELF